MSKQTQWYSIRARAQAASAEVLIYGDIGESWWGDSIAANHFVREIAALDVEQLTVRINSYGGSVSDGIAIHNALKRHKATVTTTVDGVAASIASLIAMAGDNVEMAENATLMIHAPWGSATGNSEELRQFADLLDTWADAMATSYASKTGRDKAEIIELLTDGKDHWYTAEEALADKFVDSIVTATPAAASLLHGARARYKSFPSDSQAAAAAAFNHQEPTMNVVNTQPAAPSQAAAAAPTQEQINAAASAALAADKSRRDAIAVAFAKFSKVDGVSALERQCADDHSCTVDQANAKLLAHIARDATPIAGTRVVTIEDERDKFRAGVSNAIMARSGLAKQDSANQYRGYSLFEIARASMENAGIKTGGMDKMALVAAAFTHTGSDFPLLLANVAEKAMMKGYEEAEETFQLWTTAGVLSDFKAAKRVDLNTFPALAEVADGAEYSYATIGERGESIQLATYGKRFSITRHTIINDDLDAFSKIPRRMGRAAIRTVGNLAYAVLTGNPTMSDGVALFHASHGNVPTGAAISTASVDAMRVAMAKQTDGEATALNVRLAHLLVPVALEGTARVVAESEFEVGASAKNNTVPNSVRGTFDVISDARLDVASANTWYGAANSAMHDTVEVAYLDGNQAPTLEQQSGWAVDGVEFKVRIDAGVKALDHRTLAMNAGA